jgi:hypothetical protein
MNILMMMSALFTFRGEIYKAGSITNEFGYFNAITDKQIHLKN